MIGIGGILGPQQKGESQRAKGKGQRAGPKQTKPNPLAPARLKYSTYCTLPSMDDEPPRPRRLTKPPPPNASFNARMSANVATQLRHPSTPHSPSSSNPSSREHYDHQRTQSSHTSSSSSLDRSPTLATSKFSPKSQQDPYNTRYSYSFNQSLNGKRSDEFTHPPVDATGGLGTLDSTKASGYQNSLRRPGPPPLSHTSPDPRMMSPSLRQSASFSVDDRSRDITPTRSETSSSSKRFSDEGRTSAPWKKKSGFSSFVSTVLGSPRSVKISAPENPVHVTHVGFDNETGQFTVSCALSRSLLFLTT